LGLESKIVITGRDPVIHAFSRSDPSGDTRLDGRIRSGHDESLQAFG
jgi:hypothetical protein